MVANIIFAFYLLSEPAVRRLWESGVLLVRADGTYSYMGQCEAFVVKDVYEMYQNAASWN
jgi:hypothetical protein